MLQFDRFSQNGSLQPACFAHQGLSGYPGLIFGGEYVQEKLADRGHKLEWKNLLRER